MEQRTVYIASDGTQFSDPELCGRYERSKARWESALQSVQSPSARGGRGDWLEDLEVGDWIPSDYPDDPAKRERNAVLFLKRLNYLQRLAAFMAAEETPTGQVPPPPPFG
jgi:hypothetical protein